MSVPVSDDARNVIRRLKLLGGPHIRYLSHGPIPSLVVYNVHLQDLHYTESYKKLSRAKRFAFNRNLERSVPIFVKFIDELRERECQFAKMSDACQRARRTLSPLVIDG